jgi:hypothetical protein
MKNKKFFISGFAAVICAAFFILGTNNEVSAAILDNDYTITYTYPDNELIANHGLWDEVTEEGFDIYVDNANINYSQYAASALSCQFNLAVNGTTVEDGEVFIISKCGADVSLYRNGTLIDSVTDICTYSATEFTEQFSENITYAFDASCYAPAAPGGGTTSPILVLDELMTPVIVVTLNLVEYVFIMFWPFILVIAILGAFSALIIKTVSGYIKIK